MNNTTWVEMLKTDVFAVIFLTAAFIFIVILLRLHLKSIASFKKQQINNIEVDCCECCSSICNEYCHRNSPSKEGQIIKKRYHGKH